jgi:dienelactone hydrolase
LKYLRQEIREFLDFSLPEGPIPFTIKEEVGEAGYSRQVIQYYGREGDTIPAYLLIPEGEGPFPAVLLYHQHNGERHIGKSEMCGLVGDPFLAFGPALAKQGIAVLAPDSICFEDRRRNVEGVEPHELDVAQHYDEMCYRLLRGDTLMRKILDDGAHAITLLREHPLIRQDQIGVAGHSYGGSTVLFHMAVDERIKFGCSSGAACSYQYRMENELGIEMSSTIPGFIARFEIVDLVKCMAPRPFLIASATEDKHSKDADKIYEEAQEAYIGLDTAEKLTHFRYEGGHGLTKERFEEIVGWLLERVVEVAS